MSKQASCCQHRSDSRGSPRYVFLPIKKQLAVQIWLWFITKQREALDIKKIPMTMRKKSHNHEKKIPCR